MASLHLIPRAIINLKIKKKKGHPKPSLVLIDDLLNGEGIRERLEGMEKEKEKEKEEEKGKGNEEREERDKDGDVAMKEVGELQKELAEVDEMITEV